MYEWRKDKREKKKDHSKVLLESSAQKTEETVKKKDPQDILCYQAHQDQGMRVAQSSGTTDEGRSYTTETCV